MKLQLFMGSKTLIFKKKKKKKSSKDETWKLAFEVKLRLQK